MVRIGIIGIGGFAENHWHALEEVQRSGACQIVAAAVIDPENHTARLEELRGRGTGVYTSAAEMFDAMRGGMDAVAIPTPIHTHAELMIAAVRSGYHVFLEKPPAATIQEVDEMIAAARQAGRICAVGFQELFASSIALLKLRIAEGALGAIEQITCVAGWIRRQDYYDRADWAGRARLGSAWVLDGTVNNPLSHYIVNMLHLATPDRHRLAAPAAVRAELYAAHDITGEDTSAVEVLTAEGPRCYFLTTLCADEQFDVELSIRAANAIAYQSRGRVCIRYNDGRIEEPAVDDTRVHVEKFENFIAAVQANDSNLLRCSLEMARPHTLVVNGAFESARMVRRIGPEFIRTAGEGAAAKTIIEGIDAAIPQAASECRLFSDLDLPWARRTETFDLTGYTQFPVQFTPAEAAETPRAGDLPFG